MIHTTIELKPDYAKAGISHSDCVAKLTTYIVDHHSEYRGDKTRPLILICPGGGYMHLSSREAEPIALRMNAHGYNACILYYSLAPDMYPSQLLEAAMAVDYIKNMPKNGMSTMKKYVFADFPQVPMLPEALEQCGRTN